MLGKLSIVALAFAVIAAVGIATSVVEAGGGGCRDQPVTEERGTTVLMELACFKPTIAHISAGETVTFINQDEMLHTVTGVNSSWGDYTETELGQGDSVEHRFSDRGVYPYYCLLHPGMIGVVVVDGAGGEPVLGLAIAAGTTIGAGALAVTGGFLIGRRPPR